MDQVEKSSESDLPDVVGIDDPLMRALEYFTKHYALPFSQSVAVQGLPVTDGKLSLSLFEDAAGKLGLSTKVLERQPSKVPEIVCPYIVMFKNGDVGVVTEKGKGLRRLSVLLPALGTSKRISARSLDKECEHRVIYVTPMELVNAANPEDEKLTFSNSHWLWGAVRRFWPSWMQVIIAALFINLLGLALPLFVMNVYDRVIPYNAIPTLWALALGVSLALGFDFLLRMLRALVIDSSTQRIDMKVSSDLFDHALDTKMSERPPRAGDIASQIREFESVRDFFASASITSMIDLLFVGLFLFILWVIVGPLALVPLFAVPVVLLISLLVQIPLSRSVAKMLASSSNRHAVLIESMVGAETIKTIAAEGTFQRKWETSVAASVRANSSTRFWSSLVVHSGMAIQQSVSIIIIVWGVYLVAAGDISIGALIASNILAGRVLAPLSGIAMTLARLQQSMQSLRGLNALMKLGRDHEKGHRRPLPVSDHSLELRNVSFNYPGHNAKALDDVSIRIEQGEKIGIIGRVGSGKSTIGKLLCGLFDTSEGNLVLGDTDIQNRAVADVRNAICYVGQDPDLFTGTIRENIVFDRVTTAEEFEYATSVSGVAAFANVHPMGYEMPVGERGRLISGGQRQAVVLARALLRKPSILFLDEPTSSMDNKTEAAFVQNMATFSQPDATLIISTHRTSLLELVDRVIVIDQGKIIADGSKSDVLSRINPKGVSKKKKLNKGTTK